MLKRRRKTTTSSKLKRNKLPKEKKAFCSSCEREFPLKDLLRSGEWGEKWICITCLHRESGV